MAEQQQPIDPQQEEMAAAMNTDEQQDTTQLQEPVSEENEQAKLLAEIEMLKDKYIRQAAEFDNFRKRTAKERMELIQTAGRDVIQQMLEVLDDSERAEKVMNSSSDLEVIKSGITLVFQKLRATLQSKGLKEMESIGQPFDADLHEAITEIPAPTPELQGKVLDQVEKGYYLNDKIIRFAKVVVGK